MGQDLNHLSIELKQTQVPFKTSLPCNWIIGGQGVLLARILYPPLVDWSLNIEEVTYQSVARDMVILFRNVL